MSSLCDSLTHSGDNWSKRVCACIYIDSLGFWLKGIRVTAETKDGRTASIWGFKHVLQIIMQQ